MQYLVLKSCSIAFGILAFIAPVLVVMSGPHNQMCGNPAIGMLGIAGLSIIGSFIVAFAFEKEAYRLRHLLPPVPRPPANLLLSLAASYAKDGKVEEATRWETEASRFALHERRAG
jgi:hypothetical protein